MCTSDKGVRVSSSLGGVGLEGSSFGSILLVFFYPLFEGAGVSQLRGSMGRLTLRNVQTFLQGWGDCGVLLGPCLEFFEG